MGKYLLKVKYGYHKVWGDDTGRNLNFETVGTFGGVCPKITCYIRGLEPDEVKILAPIFDKARQSVTYDDPVVGKRTMTSYTNDWEIEYENMQKGKAFSISFIDTKPRR